MSLLSLIATFLLEQLRPLPYRQVVLEPLARLADFLESRFNAGEYRHGILAWVFGVVVPVALTGGAYFLLYRISPLLAWGLNVVVLYLTMGFRHFSHYFTDIHLALRAGELDHARALLGEWRGRSADSLSSGEISRLAIEEALVATHRQVFAVLLWFVLLPGPCGALLYRLSDGIAARWSAGRGGEDFEAFGRFARQAFAVIDWLPLRVTATGFAIVGDFEDAIYCWRTQAERWTVDPNLGIVLASGAGALGVRLGMPIVESGEVTLREELGTGEDADVDFMQSAVGLVWRALVLWLLLLILLELASLVG